MAQAKKQSEPDLRTHYLTDVDEVSTAILQAHLIVERMLDACLVTLLGTQPALGASPLTFFQKTALLRALPYRLGNWDLIIGLNHLREGLIQNQSGDELHASIQRL